MGADIREGARAGDAGFPDTGTIEVHLDIMLPRKFGDALDLAEWCNHAVERILKADDTGRATMNVVINAYIFLDILEGQVSAILGNNRLKLSTCKRTCTIKHVSSLFCGESDSALTYPPASHVKM